MTASPDLPLLVVGLDQAAAPIHLRERLAFGPADLPAALSALRGVAAEGFILSTCNRVEVYTLGADLEAVVGFLAETRGLEIAEIAPHLFAHRGADAVRRLFAVAAGLDSMVLGEDQILAQLKAALAQARTAEALGPGLNRLGHDALAAGKQVRTATAIGRRHLSVVSVALHLAGGRLGSLRSRRVLVVGAGATAELALKHLAGLPTAWLAVSNRTDEHGAALAARYSALALPWANLEDGLAEADLLISCTAAPTAVFDAPLLARALARRPDRPLLALDLAVPRDVDPNAADLPGLTLYDVDSLGDLCKENRRQRAGEIAQAEEILGEAVGRYLDWWVTRGVAPTIAALRSRAEELRDAEVARTLARLPGLSPQEQAVVRSMAAALVNKLLHQPVTALKAAPTGAALADPARRLFGLGDPTEIS